MEHNVFSRWIRGSGACYSYSIMPGCEAAMGTCCGDFQGPRHPFLLARTSSGGWLKKNSNSWFPVARLQCFFGYDHHKLGNRVRTMDPRHWTFSVWRRDANVRIKKMPRISPPTLWSLWLGCGIKLGWFWLEQRIVSFKVSAHRQGLVVDDGHSFAYLPVEQLISPLPSPVFAAYGLLGPEIFGH